MKRTPAKKMSSSSLKDPKFLHRFTSIAVGVLVLGGLSLYAGSGLLSSCVVKNNTSSSSIMTMRTKEPPPYRIIAAADQSKNRSYELATTESFGFWNDLDDTTWRLHQHRARTEATYFQPDQPNAGSNENVPLWLLNNVDPVFTCPHLRRVGGRGDGPKWTCDPHRLVHQPDCLIYSIGSKGIYSFEDGLVDLLKGYDPTSESSSSSSWLPNCEIHVFDPDPKYARANDPERRNIHYHAIGLKSSYQPFKGGKFPETFEFLSLPDILKRLGHEHRRIDIFKIDCEGCEWTSYQDWLDPTKVDIRQILVETHGLPSESPNAYFDRFAEMGFVLFSKEANTHPWAKPFGTYFEWGYIRLHRNFLNLT